MNDALTVMGWLAPEVVDFLLMAGTVVLVGAGALIWVFFFRRKGRSRRKYHHHHESHLSDSMPVPTRHPPPVRPEEKPPGRSTPPSQP